MEQHLRRSCSQLSRVLPHVALNSAAAVAAPAAALLRMAACTCCILVIFLLDILDVDSCLYVTKPPVRATEIFTSIYMEVHQMASNEMNVFVGGCK
jgi:hypothetical protein